MHPARLFAGSAVLLLAASCAAIPKPSPSPAPTPAPATPRPAAPTQMMVPPRQPWDEREFDGGEWRYDAASRTAEFVSGAAGLVVMTCVPGGGLALRASLGTGDRPQRVDLSTSFGVDALAMTSDTMTFAADDPRLDRIAFSRGRFALDAANGSSLTIPVHAEIGRVIEDCRG